MTQFSKWKTIGYAVAIFVAGGISGGALGVYETKSHLFAPPPEQEMALRILNRLRTNLDLSPEQLAKIRPIIEGSAKDLHSIRAETAQRINKVFDDSYAQVSAILTPEQRTTLNQMQKERWAMMQRHWQLNRWRAGGQGGPGGGPRRDGAPHETPEPSPSTP